MTQVQKMEKAQDRDPNRLLDALIQRKKLKNDAALCRVLQVSPPLISKIRSGKLSISADVMIRMHDVFEMQISELRQLMGSNQ